MQRLARSWLVITACTLGGLAGASCSASTHPAAPAASHSIAKAAQQTNKSKSTSTGITGVYPCMPADIATVAVARPAVTSAILSSLTPQPLAVVTDTRSGKLAFFHPDAVPVANYSATFTANPEMVPADPTLQSCDYMLRDRPAAQPFINAAVTAAVAAGLAQSSGSLQSNLAEVEIGDNPLTTGSVVVALLINGPPQGTIAGHTVYGPDSSIFVILDRASMNVTGVAAGSW